MSVKTQNGSRDLTQAHPKQKNMCNKYAKIINVDLYIRNNNYQKREVLCSLEEYGKQIKWKNDRIKVIDIGCGDGGITMSILKKYIPDNFEKLVCCDINENMIKFASEHYETDRTSFMILDIEGDLPNELRGTFNHAFSFFVMHWIENQKLAFTNIYDLLSEGGQCFLVFIAYAPEFDVYRVLSQSTKWKFWLKDFERFISPYHGCQDPEKKLKQMMTSIGFTSIEVKCLKKPFMYPSLDAFKGHVKTVNPFKIPKNLEEDYLKDFFNVLRDMHVIDHVTGDDGPNNKAVDYGIMVAMGEK